MKSYILAIDCGTSGIKVSLFDEQGIDCGSVYREYPSYFPKNKQVEQYPDDWWNSFCSIVPQMLENAGIAPKDVSVIAPSGQMSAVLPIGQDGKLVTPRCMIWADVRSTPEVEKSLERLGGFERYYEITASAYALESYSGYKIMWLKEHAPEVYEKTKFFLLSSKEYMGYRLTGTYATDYSDASHTAMMDYRTKTWSDEILESMGGVDKRLLPPIKCASDLLGHVTKEAAAQTGLLEGTPVCVGGGDVAVVAAGAVANQSGRSFLLLGSGCTVGMYLDRPMLLPKSKRSNTAAVDGKGFVTGYGGVGGAITYRWLRDTVLAPCVGGDITFQKMDEIAEKAGPGAHGVIFNPIMRSIGDGLSTRGWFLGLGLDNTYGDMCRAVLEGVAFSVRQSVEEARSEGHVIDELYMFGGGSKSPLWRQIIADVLQIPVRITNMNQNTNAFGAALSGGICIGIWKDYQQGGQYVKSAGKTLPHKGLAPIYETMYGVYREASNKIMPYNCILSDTRDRLNSFGAQCQEEES